MPRITDFTIIETPAQDALIVEKETGVSDFIPFFVESIYKLGEYIREQGCIPSNAPYMRIKDNGTDIFNITVGTTTPKPMEGNGEIQKCIIPAGKKLICYYQGNNEEMFPFYEELERYLSENGYKKNGAFYEHFLNGSEFGIDKLLTKVICEIESI